MSLYFIKRERKMKERGLMKNNEGQNGSEETVLLTRYLGLYHENQTRAIYINTKTRRIWLLGKWGGVLSILLLFFSRYFVIIFLFLYFLFFLLFSYFRRFSNLFAFKFDGSCPSLHLHSESNGSVFSKVTRLLFWRMRRDVDAAHRDITREAYTT